jgi:phytoene synthase
MDPLLAYSQQSIAQGSKSFAMAARLFDRRTRARAMLLYAWCRHCDDQIDGQELGLPQRQPDRALQEERLQALHRQTRSAMAGEAQQGAAFQSFQRVVSECDIPARYPLELLDGFAMDVRGERYRNLNDTLRYCYHVAGTVGAMMACAMGVTDYATLVRGIHLGIALQLTNIARDVMDDASVGRLYLPADWLEEAQVTPEPASVLEEPDRVAHVVRRLLDAAEPYYASARHGVVRLPYRSAWAVNAAARVYREIGSLVRRRGSEAWSTRTSASNGRKLTLLLGAGMEVGLLKLRGGAAQPPAPAGLWEPAEEVDVVYPSKR